MKRLMSEENAFQAMWTEIAANNFYHFCRLKDDSFYKPDRAYLEDICGRLERFVRGDGKRILIMNMPPRHGKSYTAMHLAEWLLGIKPTSKIITASYNEMLSGRFAQKVRDDIMEIKADAGRIVYSDIFPQTRIKKGDASKGMWSIEGQYNSYLSTSPNGSATGFGANIIIFDDLIKSAEEAYNAAAKEKIYEWYCNTMLSRLEEGGKIVVIMTRWAEDDLAGRIIQDNPPEDLEVITYKAVQNDGTMLCPEILSEESCELKKKAMGLHVWSANYQQVPINIKGRLYSGFKTYEDVPRDAGGTPLFTAIRSYTDTADEGTDYLAHVVYGEYNKEAYILDIIYTQEPMEITESKVAASIYDYDVRIAEVESNNGGKGFARAVDDILRNRYQSNRCSVRWFAQRSNKISRILTNAPWVMEHIYFPINWRDKWGEAYEHLMNFQREGKNEHDDIEDALTGVAERILERSRGLKMNPRLLRR